MPPHEQWHAKAFQLLNLPADRRLGEKSSSAACVKLSVRAAASKLRSRSVAAIQRGQNWRHSLQIVSWPLTFPWGMRVFRITV